MELTKELFVIKDAKNYIIYAPLDNSALKVNSGVIKILQRIKKGKNIDSKDKFIVEILKKNRIVNDREYKKINDKNNSDYSPNSVTIIPTNNCNLRCLYCYSKAGENSGKMMSFEIAKTAIDFIIDNAKRLEKGKVNLGFHGGGEPLLPINMKFIKQTFDYFKSKAKQAELKYHISSVTNGIINRRDLKWITQNFDNLTISLDGPEDIQNYHRPKIGNKPSYNDVIKTINYLEEKKFKYGIRSTITEYNVNRLKEIIELFHSISTNKIFHFEPLFECGRCETTKIKSPKPKIFIKRFLEARKTAKRFGIKLYYSGIKLKNLSENFCGATGTNFFINPNGKIITCLDTSREINPQFHIFHIGEYNFKSKKFIFNRERIRYLQSRTISNIPHCSNCFAKYNCSGDCLAKTYYSSGDLFDTSKNTRCFINRELLKQEINDKLGKLKNINATSIKI